MALLDEGSLGEHDAHLQRAIATAIRFIGYRPRSEMEVRARLARRLSPKVVQMTVDWLKDSGYLDDVAFAEAWVSSRQRSRPRSISLVSWELRKKGVARGHITDAVAVMDDQESAYSAARIVARRFYKADDALFKRRMWAYLRRRGFSSELVAIIVGRVEEEVKGDLEETPDGDLPMRLVS